MRFRLTSGNISDNKVVASLTQNLKGWSFDNKGDIDKKLETSLLKKGLELFTRLRKNMKQKTLNTTKKAYLNKRGVIETVIDPLKSIYHIQHTRHHSPTNFLVTIFVALFAYVLKPHKVKR